ncbi:MAG: hypothetical protein A2020_04520 [Lentisphaerae bacterium GWF2_45_14]|nr:MAG: hypothetical protein A2020_04520 [Lentisphaerae bacterium GWF2_45_14]
MGKLESKIHLYRTLLCQIDAGVPIVKALRSVGRSRSTAIAGRMASDIEEGRGSLSEVMAGYPAFFSEYEVKLLAASERTGRMEDAFRKLADIFEKRRKLRSEIVSALTYPVLLYLAGSILLPFISYMINGKSQVRMFAETILLLSLPLLIALPAAILRVSGKNVRKGLYFVIGGIPGIGRFAFLAGMADFFEIYGSCVQSGTGAITSVQAACSACRNPFLAWKLAVLPRMMEAQNCPLSEAVRQSGAVSKLFDDAVLSMISSGEETGRIPETSFIVAERYEEGARKTLAFLARAIPTIIYLAAVCFIAWQIIILFSSLIRKTTEAF